MLNADALNRKSPYYSHTKQQADTTLPNLLSLDQFNFFQDKTSGISSGAVYKDQDGHPWMIKQSQYGDLTYGIKEYVAGAVFQHILGHCAPTTELILDPDKGTFLIGSKFLDNFQTLNNFSMTYGNGDFFSHPPFLDHEFGGKEIHHFADVLSSVVFLNDKDAHTSNLGIMEYDNSWEICKIDHSYAFYSSGEELSLSTFKYQFSWYSFDDQLYQLGYDNLYQSIKMIASLNLDDLNAIVEDKMDVTEFYLDLWEQSNHKSSDIDLPMLKQEILDQLQSQHVQFNEILKDLELDHILFEDDVNSLNTLIEQGLDAKRSIESLHIDEIQVSGWENMWGVGDYGKHSLIELAQLYDSPKVTELLLEHTEPSIFA